MGFFSAIKKMFTSPEQDAKTQEELAGKAGQESAQEAGREAGKDAGKENPAGGRPQAKPAPAGRSST